MQCNAITPVLCSPSNPGEARDRLRKQDGQHGWQPCGHTTARYDDAPKRRKFPPLRRDGSNQHAQDVVVVRDKHKHMDMMQIHSPEIIPAQGDHPFTNIFLGIPSSCSSSNRSISSDPHANMNKVPTHKMLDEAKRKPDKGAAGLLGNADASSGRLLIVGSIEGGAPEGVFVVLLLPSQ